jgi:hypothetical protein
MSKWLAAATLVVMLPVAGRAQFGRPTTPPRQSAGHGVEVPGWWARLDNPRDITTPLKFVPDGSSIHATTGPAAIFWDPQQTASGQYTVTAKFTVDRLPRFEEGYGLFIGGTNLDKDNERLTAFLVREDGSYAVRVRRGNPVPASQLEWLQDPALARPDASGHVVNELSIRVEKGDVIFLANGREVTRRPSASLDTNGIAGVRVSQDLDLRVDGFKVTRFAS